MIAPLYNPRPTRLPDTLHLSWESLARLADAHTLATQHWLSSRAPHARTFTSLGTRVASTGLKIRLLNQALDAHYPPKTPTEDINADIESVKAFMQARPIPGGYWWL